MVIDSMSTLEELKHYCTFVPVSQELVAAE